MTHDYVCPGTASLFAAYDLASGSALARRTQSQPDCWEPDRGISYCGGRGRGSQSSGTGGRRGRPLLRYKRAAARGS